MFKFRRLLSFAIAIVMCMGSFGILAYAETSVVLKNNTWVMSANSDKTSHTADFEWNNLSICATEAKTANFDGTYLKLQGGANKISFKAAGSCTITVTVKSNSTTVDRGLSITNSKDEKLGSIAAPMTGDNTESVNYNGYGEEIFLTPTGGGVSIKSISVVYDYVNNLKGDINADGNVNQTDAALLLRYIMGKDNITDLIKLSAANGNNDGEINILDANWILNHIYEVSTETTTMQVIDTSDGKEVRNYDELTAALSFANAKVYVMNDIEMGDIVQLTKGSQSIIGVPDDSGHFPVLNFENMTGKNDIVNQSSSDSDVGLRVRSSNNVIKNVIVEKAHDNGIQIKGTGVTGNLIENCIVRYNNDSGIQVTGGACGNTLRGVYSYRNCDVYTLGGNADGFAIKLSAGPLLTTDSAVMDTYKNVCIDCYAWENGDDGWDSFDYPLEQQSTDFQSSGGRWTYRNDYVNCMCWSNGTPANCLGYNDYVNGFALDESLPFIMRFKKINPTAYETFVTQYNNGSLCSRADSASTYYGKLDSLFETIPTTKGDLAPSAIALSSNWGGNPNGFKLGSKYTQSNSERYMTNCIAFDHESNGFDKNNSGAKIWAENCISFCNKINYHLAGYTAYNWTNVYGWSGTTANNKPTAASGVTIAINGGADKENEIRAAADRIVNYANNNKVVCSNIFETVF